MASNLQVEIVKFLQERGHTTEEIDKIMARLADYDEKMVRDSLFASFSSGSFNIESIIQDSLKGPQT